MGETGAPSLAFPNTLENPNPMTSLPTPYPVLIGRFRLVLGLFIVALVLSGLTAFPLLTELRLLERMTHSHLGGNGAGAFVASWINLVYHGLDETYRFYPWIAYGTDWLAFAHIVIALFFVGPWLDPRSGRSTLLAGIAACALVLPLAFICGPVRGIPFYWRLIDCSFGVIGVVPLLYCLALQKRIVGRK
ncbi:hypothetical protein SAMN05444156_1209 [Verrucomicrobium sp. GAS474]|nr:hypothetical protein SAMN05444156_1209 [Verrucomicrobium sp. GAS474]